MNNNQIIRHCPDGYPVYRLGCRMKWRGKYCRHCRYGSRLSLMNWAGLTGFAGVLIAASSSLLAGLRP